MSERAHLGDEARREDAAAWVVRLQAPDLGIDDALAFDSWLQADARNGPAYDRAVEVWRAFTPPPPQILPALAARRGPRPQRRLFLAAGGLAAAAALAVAVLPTLRPAPTETYATARGERRSIALADGSTIDLNAGTRLTVALRRDAREVVLAEGQAVFDVAHDARRPFVVAAGDRTVRVVGTQFDVRRRDGKVAVTVARGAVEVHPAEGASGRAWRLRPGQRLEHTEGAPGERVAATEPAEVLGWRAGRLVYRGQPLSEVVADLNQQFATPIRIEDPALAATPVSGVLVLDDQDAVVRRLALLAPIRAVRSGEGVVLRREAAPGR